MIRLLNRLICDLRGLRGVGFAFTALFLAFSANVWASQTGSVCFKESCFSPEIARTQPEKQRGLMERSALAPEEGMLFVYDKEVRTQFWMKKMRMPLDFIWLDALGKTIDLRENVAGCSPGNCPVIESRGPFQYLLEVAAGSVQKAGIKIGDQAMIKLGETQ